MGTSGVPINIPKKDIKEALKRRKGRVTWAANDLDINYKTLKKLIDEDPELQELTNDLRHLYNETMLDSAEDTLMFGISKRNDDLGNALKASFYILNNKGKSRGYTGQIGSDAPNNDAKYNEVVESFLSQRSSALKIDNTSDPKQNKS